MDTSETALSAPPPLTDAGSGVASRFASLPEWLVVGVITLVSGFVRFWRLSVPHSIIPLDETYYAKDAYAYLQNGVEGGFAVHPPVGKWLIAGGIKIFGYRPFGWRAAAALFGTLAILVIYLIAKRLWGTRFAAVTASISLASDGLFFVQSRIAMLDIFLAFFVLLAFWFMVEDRERTAPDHRGFRWWRIAAGIAWGLAGATKWAAAPPLIAAAAVAFVWEILRLRRRQLEALETHRRAVEAHFAEPVSPETYVPAPPAPPPFAIDELLWQGVKIATTFVLLPLTVYVASYTPWFLSTKRYVPPRCDVDQTDAAVSRGGVHFWLCYQREIKDYHLGLDSVKDDGTPVHPYMSRAWSWPWIGRPAAHYFSQEHEGNTNINSEIVGIPNPIVWWTAFFIGIPMLLWWSLRRDPTAGLLIVMIASLYLPWLVTTRPLFMFYMTPAVPFLVLAVTHVVHRVVTRWPAVVPVASAYVALAVVGFAYFYPVLAAYPIPEGGLFGWRGRMWGQTDCTSKGVKLWCWI